MDKKLVDIVLQKSFIELSKKEREELLEWCSSEDEFNQIKQVFIEIELMKNKHTETVRPETKKSLDSLFLEKRRKDSVIWNSSVVRVLYPVEKAFHRRPLFQIAAVLLLLFSVYPFIQKTAVISDSPQLAKNEAILKLNKNEIQSQLDKKVTYQSVETKKTESEISIEEFTNDKIKHELLAENIVFTEQLIDSRSEIGSVPSMSSENLDVKSSLHSDGVFLGTSTSINYSQPVSENPNILDLLTVVF